MNKVFIIITSILLALFTTIAIAESGDGGVPGEFLRFGVGTRGLGMGRAYSAVTEGSDAVYWNPAGLGGLMRWEFQAMHATLYYDSRYDFVSLAYPIHKNGGFALGFVSLGMNGLEQRDESNTKIGDFGVSDWAVMAGYGRYMWMKRIRVGIGTKFISEGVGDNSANGFGGVDIGLITKDMMRKLRLAVVAQGLGGGKIAEDEYPMTLKFGAQYRLFRPLIVSAEINMVPDKDIKPRVGLEYKFFKGMFIRAGYDMNEVTAGFSYNFNRLNLLATNVNLGGGEAEVGYAAGIMNPVGNDYARVSVTLRGKENIGLEELQSAENPCERLSEYEVLLNKDGVVGAGANLIFGDCNFNFQSVLIPLSEDPDFKEVTYYFKEAYIGKFGKNWKDVIITNESAKAIFNQKTHYMFAEALLHTSEITDGTENLINDLIFAGGDSIIYDSRLQFDLAYCLEKLGKTDSAITYYEQLTKLELDRPEKIIALYRLSELYKTREPEKALQYLNILVSRYQSGFWTDKGARISYPMYPKFKDNTPFDDALVMMGDIYKSLGGEDNLANAIKYYTNVLLLCPDLDKTNIRVARERLADTYEQIGKSDIAKKVREGSL